ncbi:MAG: HlyD family efflux transporter periplasmic adaptor subunit [Lachnospiraceae bacterium]|nr:HlyD family efflux transporter periplasmic adaptor subunit [Lachnospiraceae bacterium]
MAKNNIREYKKPKNFNIGTLVFIVILLYLIVTLFTYFNTKHIVGYQVKTGSLSVSNVYEGIAMRDEVIVNSTQSGYINYYAREGEKVGSGKVVCTIDESGELQDILLKSKTDGSTVLSDKDLSEIKNDMINFKSAFNEKVFDSVYDFKSGIEGNVLKYSNQILMENLSEINSRYGNGMINMCTAPESGVVIYSTDGFEDKALNEVTEEWFDSSKHQKTQLINNSIVDVGDVLYKLSDNERWNILIRVDDDRIDELVEKEYVRVKFLKNQYESWGKVNVVDGADGVRYVALQFTNSMITFATDRYVDIELITDEESGLKVPNSSITEKQFFLIPVDYMAMSGNMGQTGVNKEVYKEDGTVAVEFIPTSIYCEENNEYYIDEDRLQVGDRIRKPDSQETYTISKVSNLTGVYNINKGYADFKQIQILNSNDEYSIIKSDTQYGLLAYDYIVLDAESVKTDEFIYN